MDCPHPDRRCFCRDECPCFRDKVLALVDRLANGEEDNFWETIPPFIPPSIKKIIIFCPHDRLSVRVGPMLMNLRRGANILCLCRLHRLQRHWRRTLGLAFLYIPLGPTPFTHLIGIHTSRRRTLFFVMYSKIHDCSDPPPDEHTIPTLQNLAWAAALAGGLHISEYAKEWFRHHMPRPLLHDYPERSVGRFGVLSTDQHFLDFNQGQAFRWTCGKGDGHGRI